MHIGKNVEKIRELKGMKQETLAIKMGISQQTVSRLEQSSNIDDERLKAIADALETTPEIIKAFKEDAFINFNSHHIFNDNSSLNNNLHCTFNPLDKLIIVMEENKQLYERLLREKDEIITFFKQNQGK